MVVKSRYDTAQLGVLLTVGKSHLKITPISVNHKVVCIMAGEVAAVPWQDIAVKKTVARNRRNASRLVRQFGRGKKKLDKHRFAG